MAEENAKLGRHSEYGDGGKWNNHNNEFYNMDHEYRGKALIFSHDIYDIKDLKPRSGNHKDWQRLEKCLQKLSFSVDIFPNLTYAQIMTQIEQTAKMDHSKNDCLLIMVLTHGESHAFLYARDTHYRAEKLWYRFTDENCPTLAGKPKLFIFQACQGADYDDGITLKTNYTEADGWFEPHKVPVHPDFLLALSTVPGYYSWRNSESGSWFIQELCEELEYPTATKTDMLTILTFVSQKVALNYESRNTRVAFLEHKKEIPYFSSMLTRRLIFTKKPDSLKSQEEKPVSSNSNMALANRNSSTSSSNSSFFGYLGDCFGF